MRRAGTSADGRVRAMSSLWGRLGLCLESVAPARRRIKATRTKKRPDGRVRAAKEAERVGLRCANSATRGGSGSRDDGGLRLGHLAACGGAGDVARLDHEAFLERRIDARFDIERLLSHDFRDFGDDQRLGAIEHPLLAEREALRLAEE